MQLGSLKLHQVLTLCTSPEVQVTKGTYQLKLLARIPIHNPNFLKAGACNACALRHMASRVPCRASSISASIRLSRCIVKECAEPMSGDWTGGGSPAVLQS